jgi:hypothetical protein
MTPQDAYVSTVLTRYTVPSGPQSPTELAATAIAPSLVQWTNGNLSPAGIHYSGSYAKGTGIAGGTDVDLFISLAATTPNSLSDIRANLFRWCTNQGWRPTQQDVSVGITYSGTKIDLVPGKVQEGYTNYHSLHRRSGSWTQTNVQEHIRVVLTSGRQQEIRAIKLWRQLNGLDFPSFYLELMVIRALSGRPNNNLAANVVHALQFIGANLETARIVDPANTNNVISEDLTLIEKRRIAQVAAASAIKPNWNQIIW